MTAGLSTTEALRRIRELLALLEARLAAESAPAHRCTCGGESAIRDSREDSDLHWRRRRECLTCGARWSTRETRHAY